MRRAFTFIAAVALAAVLCGRAEAQAPTFDSVRALVRAPATLAAIKCARVDLTLTLLLNAAEAARARGDVALARRTLEVAIDCVTSPGRQGVLTRNGLPAIRRALFFGDTASEAAAAALETALRGLLARI